MCNRLINLAYKTRHKGIAKAVLVYLADQVRKKDRDRCYPAVKTIARNVGASERTVRYKLKDIEAAGDITRHFRFDQTTLYEVHPGKGCTPAKPAGVQAMSATPANDDRTPCKIRSQTLINPKDNQGARPIGTLTSRFMARQVELDYLSDPVDPEEFSAFVRKLGKKE